MAWPPCLGRLRNGPATRSSRTALVARGQQALTAVGWAPGSIDTILAGGEPKETVVELHRTTPATQGYALRPTNPDALSQASTEELLLELRRRIIAPRERRHDAWDSLDPQGDWPE
jgi:hypothetical protein